MIIKTADEKSHDINVLQSLLLHPGASNTVKSEIEFELRCIKSGIKGESEAAYEIDFYYGDNSKNWVVLHDLRIEHKGASAQIDHILINRFLDIYVLESKRFVEGISINEHGEFSAFYSGKAVGVASPVEQNKKHCLILNRLIDDGVVELPRRLGFAIRPSIKSLILISKNARISRPKSASIDLTSIIKVDQFKVRVDREYDKDTNPLSIAKVISPDTLQSFARQLALAHTPIQFDWHTRFGLSKETQGGEVGRLPKTEIMQSDKPVAVSEEHKSKLACASCGTIVPYNVAKFCWTNKARFLGKVYCYQCQKQVNKS